MNIVLLHGGWHGAWMWREVAAILESRGHATTAVDLPFTGFADDVAAARTAIDDAGPGAVVCAHSYGGLVMSEAARGLPVVHLIYLAAFMVEEDEDWIASWYAVPTPLHAALVVTDGVVTIEPTKAHESFYGDSDEETVRMVLPHLRGMPSVERRPHRRAPAWREVPSTYVVCTRDRAIDPEVQRAMALHATNVVELAADHSPFLTIPDQVAAIIAAHAP
jgi:pimeloyl-ACP methyl ester carboxylesterase